MVRPEGPLSTVVLDREGHLLGASVASDEQWRFPGTGELPDKYVVAVERFEDRRYRWHPGVDPLSVTRAAVDNVRAGRVTSGASTLTMQVARLSRGNPPRTMGEKAVEAVLAVRMTATRSKDAILADYAEHAPFGGNTVGIEAAAWRYFGRAPDELTWAEAATLAVLPNSPALVHPGRSRDALRTKRDRLLHDLHADGVFDGATLAAALLEPLPDAPRPVPQDALPLLGHVRGERVVTTLDGQLQARVLDVADRHVAQLRGNGVHNAAVLVAEVESGEVRAYVGNVRPSGEGRGEYVDVAVAPRSTGSLLKPLLYAAMVETGELLPHELVPDVPTRFAGFSPENFDRAYEGAVPASEALARSRNVPAVWMLREHTVERFLGRLRKLGLTTLFRPAEDYGLALIVGGAEGTLWDLAGAYRDLALSAQHPDGRIPPVMRWRGKGGTERPAPYDAGAAWLTIRALFEVNRPGADAAWRSFAGSEEIAWKTGTSFGFRDAWAIGLTPEHVVAVWVGNADGEGRPGLTGTQAAAPILFDVFDLLDGRGSFAKPDALTTVRVCEESGMVAGPDCEHTRLEEVPRIARPDGRCGYCRLVHLDAEGNRAHAGCVAASELRSEPRFVLPAGMEAYYTRHHARYRPLPPAREGCEDAGGSPLAVVSPAADTAIFVPTELDGSRGRVVFVATHREPDAVVYWHLDGEFLATTVAPHELALDPPKGEHRLTLVDGEGVRVERGFEVR
ncbi:MAG: penicillin-binding protein 1C [Myxococcota bacterium]